METSHDEAAAKDAEFPAGDRFRIVRRLGAGGMGVVYAAVDHDRGDAVALKTLRTLDAAAIYHLKQEFRALADVRHPNLVRLHELVSSEGRWFFTMELVDGVDFLQWVRGSSPTAGSRAELDFDRLRAALRQLVEGVRALHESGKLHRDIKPSNVLVTREGRVVLLDFGLATDLHAVQQRSGTLSSLDGHVLGTPEYMSPEQGAARPLGPASDWYSVGVMLFEALTGRLPFEGAPLEILMAKERDDGVAPGRVVEGVPEDLDALCAALLRRDPHARPGADAILRRLGGPAATPTQPGPRSGARTPLIGRTRALEDLARAFKRSRQGRAIALHLHGGAGVGKSALLRAFLDEAAVKSHALVLSGACYERESVPYKALDGVIDALSRHLRRLTRLQVEALLPRDVHALALLFPVLERVEAIAAAPRLLPGTPDPTELRRRAFAALRELFARMADRRPLVVAIDDLQWGDLDSVALLGELLRPPYPPPMFLVASYRDEGASENPTLRALRDLHLGDEHAGREPPRAAPILDLRASTTARRRRRSMACEVHDLALAPLAGEDARALAASLLAGAAEPDDARVDTIASEASGNPFLIVEYASFLRTHSADAEGAVSLDALVEARLAPLDAAARKLLEVLAIAARPIPPAIAARAAGIDDERPVVEMLRDGHLVQSVRVGDVDAIDVYHHRIREAVAGRLTPTDVAEAHLHLANAIEAAGLDDAEALASHFQAAGARWKASHYAALAARRAEAALAFDRAATLYGLALELAPPNAPEVRFHHVRRGDALVNAGRGLEAATEYLAAAEGAPSGEMLELHRRAAQNLLQSGHVDEGIALYEGVLRVFGERVAKTPRRARASLVLRRLQLRLRGLDWVERGEDAVPPDELSRIDLFWALTTGFGLVDTIVGMDFGTRHLLAALRAGEPHRLARAFTGEAVFSAAGGAASRARTELLVDRSRQLAEQVGTPHAQALAITADAFLHYHLGLWRPARERFRRAERILRGQCSGVAWELANVRHFHLSSLLALGELRRLGERLPALLEEASSRGDLLAQTLLRVGSSSFLWLVHDDPDGGRRDVLDAVERWSRRGFLLQHFYELCSLAQFELYAGRAERAHALVAERWRELDRSLLLRLQRVRIEAWSVRARCALAAALDAGSDSHALRRDASRCAAKIERERMPWAAGLALSIRAALSHASRDEAATIAQLRKAAEAFEAADMKLHAHAARRKLGQLVAGDDGRAQVAIADVWMASEEVENPSRLTECLLPGFD